MVRYWQRLTEPALGAVPIQPYPVNSLIRWLLAGVFVVYLTFSGPRDIQLLEPVGLSVIFALLAVTELAFFRFRRRPSAMLRAWSVIMFVDLFIVMLATALDSDERSPIPALAVATVFSASEMFRPRYVLTLALTAAAGVLIEHTIVDFAGGETAFGAPVIWAILILGVGTFAVTRGQADERLRRDLIDAERREREQSENLRSALDAARSSEARFVAFSEHAPALMLMFDRGGQVTFRSSFPEAAGSGGERGLGGPIPGLRLTESDAAQVAAAVARAMAGDSPTIDVAALTEDGRRLRLRGLAFRVEDGAGAILRDVTTELELAAQVSRAQQLETVGTLAGGVAHDFNNLLTAILGNLYLAKAGLPADNPALPYLEEARTAGERGAGLVRKLLDFGRPSLDHIESTDVARLLRATVELARPALTPRVAVEIPECPAAAVMGNFGSLQQVLLNLLFNARDAMPAGGTVRIECRHVPGLDDAGAGPGRGMWEIAVTDTGTGMAPETAARIFDPFFTTKGVGAGSGLGLATSLSIVRAHGGSISVETAEGAGSTFRVTLPAA